jgi:DNA-directed RNA polymerase subunit RPC12/RpoP
MTRPGETTSGQDGAAAEGADVRCPCGSLLARMFPGGVELKCRRCRRRVVVAVGADGNVTVEGELLAVGDRRK